MQKICILLFIFFYKALLKYFYDLALVYLYHLMYTWV